MRNWKLKETQISAEQWRVVPGYPAYEISDQGRVRRIGGKILKPDVNSRSGHHSYRLRIGSEKTKKQVGNIVLLAFVGPPPTPKHECCHDNGDPSVNTVGNLYWGTKVQNQADRIRHRTSNDGERNPQVKVTAAQVAEIKRLRTDYTLHKIGSMFGISYAQVWRICQGHSWFEAGKRMPRAEVRGKPRLTSDQRREIIALRPTHKLRELAQRFGVTETQISRICKAELTPEGMDA